MADGVSGKTLSHIALVTQHPMKRRDWQRFGVPTFQHRGITVSILDVSAIVHPNLQSEPEDFPELATVDVLVAQPGTKGSELVDLLRQADLIVNFATGGLMTKDNFFVMRAIKQSATPYLVNLGNTYPGHDRGPAQRGPVERMKDTWARRPEIRITNSVIARIPPSWLCVTAASYAVRGGLKGFRNRFVDDSTQIIDAHSMDYDIFLDITEKNPERRDIAVFIDEFRPFHSDLGLMGYKKIVEPDLYYTQLRGLFDRVERELGLDVVIAASPRSNYDTMPGVFGDREIVTGRSGPLIAQSQLTIGHRSTALAFAVMFGRPILQIATEENYRHPSQTPYFDGYAEALGKPILFYDDPACADLSGAMRIDQGRYDAFMRDYVMVPGTTRKKYWDIVLESLGV